MKFLPVLILLFSINVFSQKIITSDIGNFWNAYDKIIVEKDSVKQLDLINTLYIDKGTPGLDGIMRARRYSAEEYIYAINNYPKFWQSIRKNTLKSNQFSKDIQKAVNNLKNIYPDLKPVNIYFEIGILRTGGTTIDGMSLIGSEVALADKSVITSEFDVVYPHLRSYFDTEPIKDVIFLNVHEYIHTQQKETIGNTLLSQTIMEGIAEFLAEIALNQKSPNPQIEFGFKNQKKIKTAFQKEMFSPNIYNWIMNDANNQFGMRDLGYFVGYAICKKYYEQSSHKESAVKEMIELDYNNENDLIRFVERTKYFDHPLSFYKKEFENSRPRVIGIHQFDNGSQNVNPEIKTFTINFSEEMNSDFRNFELGPLGENNLLRISKIIGFSDDKKSFTFESNLEPNKQYQILVDFGFRSAKGYPLVPYLIGFSTFK
ncbi:gliding motility protein GldB-related protein [Moheibacter sediminis]|uniref:Predicted Zn-dependent protease n=1 Tax=Moheibacter sediminis TaxID=1434700 RepID=A0A1W2BZY6_9FLAO|nr:DUF2268 domain-containing putative Zn-dependent protease [Moheibacter sediminis]SMC78411.1 Predicted Zn-dependent protease [Moheibacter sediminis]